MSAAPSVALLDSERLDELELVLGAASVAQLLAAFSRELDLRPALIAELLDRGDHANARAAAHLLKGAALTIGGGRLAALAAGMERAADDEMTGLLGALTNCASDTRAMLAARTFVSQTDVMFPA